MWAWVLDDGNDSNSGDSAMLSSPCPARGPAVFDVYGLIKMGKLKKIGVNGRTCKRKVKRAQIKTPVEFGSSPAFQTHYKHQSL
jgi:hypothetical protein